MHSVEGLGLGPLTTVCVGGMKGGGLRSLECGSCQSQHLHGLAPSGTYFFRQAPLLRTNALDKDSIRRSKVLWKMRLKFQELKHQEVTVRRMKHKTLSSHPRNLSLAVLYRWALACSHELEGGRRLKKKLVVRDVSQNSTPHPLGP